MSGRSRRDVTFERILDRNPALVLARGAHDLPELSSDEMTLFLEAIINGLLKRLRLRNTKEAKVLRDSFPRLMEMFSLSIACGDLDDGYERVVNDLGRLTIPQLALRLEPQPLQLAEEAHDILKSMPSKKHMTKRREWLSRLGLDPVSAVESDGMLVESILSHVHGLDASRVHKRLAEASSFAQ